MTDRVHVKAELELFVDDAAALKQSAYERLRSAWRGDDEFPFEGRTTCLRGGRRERLADALPIEFPGPGAPAVRRVQGSRLRRLGPRPRR